MIRLLALMPLALMVCFCEPASATSLKTLLTFKSSNGNGPVAGVMLDKSGALYGTTQYSGRRPRASSTS